MWIGLLIVLIIIFFVYYLCTECYAPKQKQSDCIITLTTYMGFRDRAKSIRAILDPLIKTDQQIIVINEWDKNCKKHVLFMRSHYPNIHFIQKTEQDKGQARSLNILIRDYLLHSPKKYWIHWEDSWVSTSSTLNTHQLVRLMDKNPSISQLQLTGDWNNYNPQYTRRLKDISILLPSHIYDKDIYSLGGNIDIKNWPLYSLRPSINRLSFFQCHSKDFYFKEDPHLWPFRFEWEFARIFLRNKGVKAITHKPYAKRIDGHVSTYA